MLRRKKMESIIIVLSGKNISRYPVPPSLPPTLKEEISPKSNQEQKGRKPFNGKTPFHFIWSPLDGACRATLVQSAWDGLRVKFRTGDRSDCAESGRGKLTLVALNLPPSLPPPSNASPSSSTKGRLLEVSERRNYRQ